MSHEFQQPPLDNFYLDLVPPGEQVPESWTKAKSLVDLCTQLDHDADQITVLDDRLKDVKDKIKESAASPAYNEILAGRVIDYLEPDGTTRFDSMIERLGICFDEGSLGIFTSDGAKTQELKELMIYGPTMLEYLGKSGQVDLVRKELKQQKALSDSFLWHYQERFDDPQNIAKFLPSPNAQDQWYRRREGMHLHTIFPMTPSIPWTNEPIILQKELIAA